MEIYCSIQSRDTENVTMKVLSPLEDHILNQHSGYPASIIISQDDQKPFPGTMSE
jgi:hypothetical protein